VPFEFRELGPETPEHVAQVQRRSPVGKFPVLVDGARSVAEASIIIEYLQMNPPGPVRLIPEDPAAALEVRFMDRFFDLYVMDGMQIAVEAALGGGDDAGGRTGARDAAAGAGVCLAGRLSRHADLGGGEGLLDGRLRGVDGAVLCGLDVPDSGALCGWVRLPRAAAGAAFACAGSG
jgi:glutathione S-transferase